MQEGRFLGTVAPAFFAGNGGLAHMHLAVHATRGSGLIQGTVPLTGKWALEGVDLPWTGAFNAHAGARFVSSNGRTPTPPPPSPLPAPEPEPVVPAPGIDESFSLQVLPKGWNTVGWTARTSAAEVAAALGDGVSAVFTFDAASQRFRRFSLAAPSLANDLAVLDDGDGVLIYVDDSRGVVLPRPPFGEPRPLRLEVGFNLATWTGQASTTEAAMRSLGAALLAAFAWDAGEQRYRVYRPGRPDLSDIPLVEAGQALWIVLQAPVIWDPRATGPVEPPPNAPPASDDVPGGDEAAIVPAGAELLQVVGPVCLNLRSAPTTIGTTPVTCLAAGTVLESFGETASDVSGREWARVRVLGIDGWVASEFTRPFDSPRTAATAAATPPVPPLTRWTASPRSTTPPWPAMPCTAVVSTTPMIPPSPRPQPMTAARSCASGVGTASWTSSSRTPAGCPPTTSTSRKPPTTSSASPPRASSRSALRCSPCPVISLTRPQSARPGGPLHPGRPET